MNSRFPPEAYRQILDVDVDRDEDEAPDKSQLLSFVDWDVLDGATPSRVLDQYARLKGSLSRKRLRKPAPRTPLTPLASPSPALPKTNAHADLASPREAEVDSCPPHSPQRAQAASSPQKLRQSGSNSAAATLPPLDIQVLQRKRVFLSPTSAATIGIEEIVQIQERQSPPKPRPSPLQLAMIPKKCVMDDEVALMPCHSLHYRYTPSLAAEIWKEPIRDRDKNWVQDELNVILALHHAADHARCAMSNPLRQHKGKWRHWEAMKLHVIDHHHHRDSAHHLQDQSTGASVAMRQRDQASLSSQILIRNQGAMISKTYCLVSAYGVGIYGRLYSSGLAERHGNTSRFLRFEAYDPATSHVYTLVVTFRDLEWVFHARQEFLVAGKKHAIIKELIALLYFRYPEEEEGDGGGAEMDDGAARLDREGGIHEEDHQVQSGEEGNDLFTQLLPTEEKPLPVLCISPDAKLSEAARRRLEREERLRCEEEERLRVLAMLLRLPRRARYRLTCQVLRLNGHKMIVSIYHFPHQIRNFLVLAYHPASARTFPLSVGVVEAASLSRIFTLPHKWNAEQKLQIAVSLLPRLHLNGIKVKAVVGGLTHTAEKRNASTLSSGDYAAYKMGLAIKDDRSGAPSEWLSPPGIRTPESVQQELVQKYQTDGHRTLKIEFTTHMQSLETATEAKVAAIEAHLRDAEAQKAKLHARDVELKEQIEEINSGKGVQTPQQGGGGDPAAASETKDHHETRRRYKAARKQIKDESKAMSDQMAVWKRDIQTIREQEHLEREKATRRLEKAVHALEREALVHTRGFVDVSSSPVNQGGARKTRTGQKARLARFHISPNLLFIASGGCVVDGRRHRYSIFDVLKHEREPTDAGPTTSSEEDPTSEPRPEQLDRMLQITLYDPASSQSASLTLSRLDWISYTKQQHEAQLLVPHFEIQTSSVTSRLAFLNQALATARETLTKLRKRTKKNLSRREQLCVEMQNCLRERQKLFAAAPWHRVMAALSERLTVRYPSAEIVLDRCIFRTILPIVTLAGDDDDEAGGKQSDGSDNTSIYCHVRAMQEHHAITFEVYDPLAGEQYALLYPESAELAKEFEVENFMEQQLHLEAVAMSLLFVPNDQTGKLELRFED